MNALWLVLAAATPLRFEEAVTHALEHHPALRVAQTETQRALAQVEQARAAALPSLSVNAVGTQLDGDRVLNGRVISAATQVGANVQLQVPLVAANRWAQWRRADAAADAVAQSVAEARRVVALNAARSWLQVLAQQRVVEAAARSMDTARAHLTYAHDRKSAGLGSELDENRAAQELAVSRQQLATATGALRRLEALLGATIGADTPISAIDEEPALAAPTTDAQRSDVQAAHARLDAAHLATTWAWSDFLPQLTAVVQPGYQNPATLTVPLWNFQAQLVLSLPLYEGGLRSGQQHEREAMEAQARAQLELVRRQASAELQAAVAQVTQADEALAAARDAAEQARRTLALAQQALRAGGSTNLEVVDAERRARDAETGVALAEDGARQARLELLAASGQFPPAVR